MLRWLKQWLTVSSQSELSAEQRSPEPGESVQVGMFKGRTKKEQQLIALQAGYQELIQLVQSVNRHLESQSERQEQLVKALDTLPQAVEGLQHVGKSAEQQSAVLELIRKQLESSVEHDQQLVDSMGRFNQTLSLMDKTSQNTASKLSSMAEQTKESERMLATMLERSEKRLVVLLSVLVTMALLIVAGAFVYVWQTKDQSAVPVQPAIEAAAVEEATAMSDKEPFVGQAQEIAEGESVNEGQRVTPPEEETAPPTMEDKQTETFAEEADTVPGPEEPAVDQAEGMGEPPLSEEPEEVSSELPGTEDEEREEGEHASATEADDMPEQ